VSVIAFLLRRKKIVGEWSVRFDKLGRRGAAAARSEKEKGG